MNMETLYAKTAPHVDWLKVQRGAKRGGFLVSVFVAGLWSAGIRDHASERPYEARATKQFEQVQRIAGPNPIATVKCERQAIKVASNVASQAISVAKAQDPDAVVPTLSAVPHCPAAPPPKPKAH